MGKRKIHMETPGTKTGWFNVEQEERMLYFTGEDAAGLYNFLIDFEGGNVFQQNGVEYTLYWQVVLPHLQVYWP